MTTQTSAGQGKTSKSNLSCFLWGCLALVILFFVTLCCLGTLIFLPLFTDYDPLGLDIRNQIEQYFPLDDFRDDPFEIDPMPEFFDDSLDLYGDDEQDQQPYGGPSTGADLVELSTYIALDFPATFDYPTDWYIETEESGVTFYDTEGYTYLYVGEVIFEGETTAREVANEVMGSVRADSQEGSFIVFEEGPYLLPTGDDAYLVGFEFTDTEGFYQWVVDLETVQGESNIYFFLSGENPEDYQFYRELIEIIAGSFSR